jgi:hypothetical protein
MTAYVPITGTRRIVSSTPANTNEATLYTSPAGPNNAVVQIWITNLTGSAANATVKWGDGSTDYSLIDTKSIAARDYHKVDCLIPMREAYTVKITSGTGSALTFTIIVIEFGGAFGGEHGV